MLRALRIGFVCSVPPRSAVKILMGAHKRGLKPQIFRDNLTLPALQKTLVDFIFKLAWGVCVERWQESLVIFFLVSVSHETKHENSSKYSEQNSRRKFKKKIGELSFCNFSDTSGTDI